MRKSVSLMVALLVGGGFTAGPAMAQSIPITPLKLIVVNTDGPGAGKVVFVAKDSAITKGIGTNPVDIESYLDVAYGSVEVFFNNEYGSNWLANNDAIAKYVNKTAPDGGATKVSVLKPGKLIKNVTKSLIGDDSQVFDISSPPSGDVCISYLVFNGSESFEHCGRFTSCSHKSIAGGTGWKLVCKGTGAPWDCTTASCAGLNPRETYLPTE